MCVRSIKLPKHISQLKMAWLKCSRLPFLLEIKHNHSPQTLSSPPFRGGIGLSVNPSWFIVYYSTNEKNLRIFRVCFPSVWASGALITVSLATTNVFPVSTGGSTIRFNFPAKIFHFFSPSKHLSLITVNLSKIKQC